MKKTMKNEANKRYTVIARVGAKTIVEYAHKIEEAREYAAVGDNAIIIDTWRNKIEKYA
jgi:hypothetical protein